MAETGLSRVRLAGATVDLGPYPVSLAFAALTCALAPAYVIRWHVAFYPSTVLEDSIFLTVLAFAAESWRHRAIPVWRTPFTWPAALFLVAGAISVVVPPDQFLRELHERAAQCSLGVLPGASVDNGPPTLAQSWQNKRV